MLRIYLITLALTAILVGCGGTNSRPEEGTLGPGGQVASHRSEIAEKIDRYLRAMESLGFSGAIIVSEGNEVVLRAGYGLADREKRRPYTPETVQTHGSITKQMTAAAILLLESRGELSVEDSIATYLDGVPRDRRSITLHHLLTHSSGMPAGIGPDEEPIEAQAYVERAMAAPLEFEPGTRYAYSNVGYALLGLVVEQVTGQSYEAVLRKEVLLPAGLADTGYMLPDWDRDRLAQGYHKGELWGTVYGRGWLDDGPSWHLRANGGLHTTVDDMRQWLETVRGRGVLSAEATQRWTKGYIDEPWGDSQYAYGWVVSNSKWGPMIAHSGSNRIFSADFVWLPEPEMFVYIQGNTSMIPARGQRGQILAAAFDPAFQMPPLVEPDADASPEDAETRVGTYRLDGGSVELTADDTRLVAKVWGQSMLDLMLGHTVEQRERSADLNRRTAEAMSRLEAGMEDKGLGSDLDFEQKIAGAEAQIAEMLAQGEDPIGPTRVLLDRIAQLNQSTLQKLHVIGSFENVPGSRFEDLGPWTTFVYAEFDNWNQYWNIIWSSDGTYWGTASGPWPSFTLVPTAEGEYKAVRQEPPWDTVELHFQDECLVATELRACLEK